MEQEHRRLIGKCFGSAVVGPRGQLVIPVEARKELGVDIGTKLLVFNHFGGRGMVFVKVEAVEDMFNIMSSHLEEFAKLLRETESDGKESDNNRG